jgi:hypothetical protein
MAISKAVFLKLSGATDLPLNLVGTADPFPKTTSLIFTEHNGLIKIQNHTNINIKHGKKIRAVRLIPQVMKFLKTYAVS